MKVTASPETDSRNVDLADQLYTQAIEHCVANIDNEIIASGVNQRKNLFYGRYYVRFSNDHWVRPPLPVLDERILVNKDVYFIRSTDLPAAAGMPFFVVCVCFLKSGDEITTKGSYSSLVGDHPTICLFVQIHIKHMTNWMMVKEGFQRLLLLFTGARSTFVHEFTHLLDDQKYEIGKHHKKSPNPQEYGRLFDYFNLNHEINARYMQIVHEILSTIDSVPGVQEHGIARSFPDFQSFFYRFCLSYDTFFDNIRYYLSTKNEKRIKKRLYKFYRYIIEQEILHSKLNKQAAAHFADKQIQTDEETEHV